MQNLPKFLWCVAAFAVIAVAVVSVQPSSEEGGAQPVLRTSGEDLLPIKGFWKSEIRRLGADRAYAAFLEQAPENDIVDTHTLAHLFGEALYEEVGINGIKTCDASFKFGCYHSFFGMAVYREGIDVLPVFDQACKDSYGNFNLPCQHGIGHGLLVHTGYGELEKALQLCEQISWQPTGGCSSGVFMEYNFHTMEADDGEYVRAPDNDLYFPCSTLSDRYQPSCYLEQTQWWESVFGSDWKKIGELCVAIPSAENRQACFHGMGNYIAAEAELDPQKAVVLCAVAPETGRAFCHEGASWLIRGSGEGIGQARLVCRALADEGERTRCLNTLQ